MTGTLREHQKVMSPKQATMVATLIEIHKWEEKVKELERKEGFVLRSNFKMTALADLCPNEIRSLIYVQVDFTDYKRMK